MNQPGIGFMISILSGNEKSVEYFQSCINKEIAAVSVDDAANDRDGALRIAFTDGTGLELYDDGRSCCESRYMTCDDDLNYYSGSRLLSAELREGECVEDDEGYVSETDFLIVTTSKGAFTICTHNDHDGYYGGMLVRAREYKP